MLRVTGGAGFIGPKFVLPTVAETGEAIAHPDKLAYAGHLANLAFVERAARRVFARGDICDGVLVPRLLAPQVISTPQDHRAFASRSARADAG